MLDRIVNCNDELIAKNKELNQLLDKRREEVLMWMKKYEDLELNHKKLEQKREDEVQKRKEEVQKREEEVQKREEAEQEEKEMSDSKAQEKLNKEELVFVR